MSFAAERRPRKERSPVRTGPRLSMIGPGIKLKVRRRLGREYGVHLNHGASVLSLAQAVIKVLNLPPSVSLLEQTQILFSFARGTIERAPISLTIRPFTPLQLPEQMRLNIARCEEWRQAGKRSTP